MVSERANLLDPVLTEALEHKALRPSSEKKTRGMKSNPNRGLGGSEVLTPSPLRRNNGAMSTRKA